MTKFYLSVTDQPLTGYNLISPFYGCNPIKINEYIDDGEATEIVCENVLEYCPVEGLVDYLTLLSKKLAHKGILIVQSNDVTLLSEAYLRGELNVIEFNKLLFGTKQNAWDFKVSSIQLVDVADICSQIGLKVLEKSINGLNFIIKLERP